MVFETNLKSTESSEILRASNSERNVDIGIGFHYRKVSVVKGGGRNLLLEPKKREFAFWYSAARISKNTASEYM
jgi:hypothetical protein